MIGVGKLGQDCAEVMALHYDVLGYDIEHRTPAFPMASSIEECVKDRDIIFIAAPTPHDPIYGGELPTSHLPNKDFDYTIVTNILIEVNKHAKSNQLVVLISTVLPGTTRRMLEPYITNARFLYNPYLIAMGTVKEDMVNPEMIIIGTKDGDVNGDANELIEFYKKFVKADTRFEIGTWDEAEAIKIFYNTFISAKIGLVNMIQDVAEINGNMNVDVVTNALKNATQRITGPRYLTAGMGDAGACHPRDNIALRYLAERLDLGYDLFHAIMNSRDKQAERMAKKLISLSNKHSLPIVIHGRAYKPYVPYTIGSYSELVGFYISEAGYTITYSDPLTNDTVEDNTTAVILMAHNPAITYTGTGVTVNDDIFYFKPGKGSIILDPWRTLKSTDEVTVVHYGNTRSPN